MKALITGGGGFLGSHIAKQLLNRGDEVTILSRGRYPEVEALGAQSVQADLCNKDGLVDILRGFDVIFHVAALAGVWGPRENYFSINVEGTRNLIAAAKEAGVPKMVYTSSPSAVWAAKDQCNVTEEDCPYPETFLTDYPESKAEGEKLALAAHSPDFAVCALRPQLIWGPGDPHLFPRLWTRYERLRIIGNGQNIVGICYVENAAHAHLLACDTLTFESPQGGKAYFVTDLKPIVMWAWLNSIFQRLGRKPIQKKISANLAYNLGAVLEMIWKTFGLKGEPFMTRFVARKLSSSFYFDLGNIQKDLDYTEIVDPADGFELMIKYFEELYLKNPQK